MSTNGTKPPLHHILVFPFPAQGHILPMLDFTHQLALHGFALTILTTPKNLPIIEPLISIHPTINTLILPLPEHPGIPSGAENLKDTGNQKLYAMIHASGKLYDPLREWFHSHPSPPTMILSGFFLGWTTRLADQLNIPRITFYASGAYCACVFEHLWHNCDSLYDKSELEIPGLLKSTKLAKKHWPTSFHMYQRFEPDSEFVRECMLADASSWGYVVNTFESLEDEYLQCLKRLLGHDRVYEVGPVSLIGPKFASRGDSGTGSNVEVLSWLDNCPDSSVLYVCFGSQKFLNNQQMVAVATGLEQSGIRFVWVVKPSDQDGYEAFLDSFEDRVDGRGLVLKGWAPQVAILSHRAVGGFFSHCGWNSMLEAIVAGVVILAWPMEADQFVNARLLADDMKVAIEVCEGGNAVPNAKELGKVIAESMSRDTLAKVRAKKLRDEALAAVGENGSSLQKLDKLVKDLSC